MTDQPTSPPPTTSPPPVPAPAPQARRDANLAGIVVGIIILGVGVYFLARETLQIALPDIGEFWPIFVIVLGAAILYGGLRRSSS